jgi:6-phosphogluconolactonase
MHHRHSFIYLLLIMSIPFLQYSTKQSGTSDQQTRSFYVGTYTDGSSKGIYRYSLQANGTMKQTGLAAASSNPSFLATSSNGRYLLAVNENGDDSGGGGTVSLFSVSGESLNFLEQQSSGGKWPCHIAINDQGFVLAANYGSGNVSLLKLDASGKLQGPLDMLQHTGKGSHPRQDEPHAHSTWFAPDGMIITVDLGTNQLWFTSLDRESNKLVPATPATLDMPPASGPRHLAFHPNGSWLYVINELSSSVSQVTKNSTGGYELGSTVSTLPASYTDESYCADIHVSADGKFLYASNRGHNSIAMFSIHPQDGSLTLIGHESVRGDWPRNFTLSPNEDFLLVANQRSNNIVSFKRDPSTGTLQFAGEIEAPSPVCLLFDR